MLPTFVSGRIGTMQFLCNRFAIVPHMCFECKRYIWMEPYRKADMLIHDRWIDAKICNRCLPKFVPENK